MNNFLLSVQLLSFLIIIPNFYCLDAEDLVIVVLSQPEGYHAAHASLLRDKIGDEAVVLAKAPQIVLSHELRINGSWTLFPLLPHLRLEHPKAKWFLFCPDNTGIRLATLIKVLSSFSSAKELWVGHALYDRQPTIIHHFADHSKRFKYPNIASGFAMTGILLNRLSERIKEHQESSEDFSIDASYELATFVFDGGKGVKLSHVPEFCVVSSSDCATYPRFFHPCSDPVPVENLFIAVKTCGKNHIERIPLIMKTWLSNAINFGLFSNQTDENLPNIHVVPHTERGHCAKTRAILRSSSRILEKENLDWLVIVDDDTILSLGRLARLLTCYNPSNPVAVGERYGFRMRQNSHDGYDFLTGGAGLVLSRPLVKMMVDSEWCDCPASTAPDDMYLFGYCLKMIGVPITHSPLFHQARPNDYATAFLASQEPVSFHKFWMIDPVEVYDRWFAEADSLLTSSMQRHIEL